MQKVSTFSTAELQSVQKASKRIYIVCFDVGIITLRDKGTHLATDFVYAKVDLVDMTRSENQIL